MIFLTVGNATQGFARLIEAVDSLGLRGGFGSEEVLAQTGHTCVEQSRYCQCRDFLPMEEFEALIRQAELIITHGGAGTLLHVLSLGRVPVVMPRRKKYGEHLDDHQVDLIQVLAGDGRVIPAYEVQDLPGAIAEARHRQNQSITTGGGLQMRNLVADALKELLHQSI